MNLASDIKAERREAFRVPGRLTPVEWSEKHRFLSTEAGSAEPGLWRSDRTPYAVEPLNAIADPHIRSIVLVWATQVGKSTLVENALAYCVDEDPGPALLVMPNEDAAIETLKERLVPMIAATPALSKHVREQDISNSGIKFDTMRLSLGWSGSAASLARRPIRFAFFDECDKFVAFSGKEADPISLGKERLQTYGHRARSFEVSTPTTREGPIWKAWESCPDRRTYHVPCPHCGEYQPLVWHQVKWHKLDMPDKAQRANAIREGKLGWYECVKCRKKIDHFHKAKMLRLGVWASEGQTVAKDGTPSGDRVRSERIGYHLSTLYSPWVPFYELAAMFIEAEGDPGKTMNFWNSKLAQPFDNLVTKTASSVIRDKASAAMERGIVPKEATHLFATADTQKGWFKLHIRAWAPGFRSQLIHESVCHSFDDLYAAALETSWRIEDASSDQKVRPTVLLIDSGGDRTNEVYEFALRDPGRIVACKGASHKQKRPWIVSQLPNGVVLNMLDTEYLKDMLSRLINDTDKTKWMPHRDVSEQYCVEMANEHKIIRRTTGQLAWVPKTEGARVESWDCEVLQIAAAEMHNLGAAGFTVEHKPDPAPQREQTGSNFVTSFRGRY